MTAPANVPVEPKRCSGRSAVTGEPCGRWAIRGGTVCPTHGGKAPHVKRRADERVARWEIEQSLAGALAEVEERLSLRTPAEHLEDMVVRSAAMVECLAVLLDRAGLVWQAKDSDGEILESFAPQAGVLVKLYRDWVEIGTKASKAALDVGVAERLAAVSERQADLMATIVETVLTGIRLELAGSVPAEVLERVWADRVPELVSGAFGVAAAEWKPQRPAVKPPVVWDNEVLTGEIVD